MNTHQLLTQAGYGGRPDYGQIARRAAALARQGLNETDLMAAIAAEFGQVTPAATLSDKPASFSMYGTPGLDFEYGAVEQMQTAMRLPVAVAGSMLPDAHPGYALCIGGVAALDRTISPSFVGYDIACRMTLTILDLPPEEFMAQRAELAKDMVAVSSFGKGSGFNGSERRDHPVMEDPLWNQLPQLRSFIVRVQPRPPRARWGLFPAPAARLLIWSKGWVIRKAWSHPATGPGDHFPDPRRSDDTTRRSFSSGWLKTTFYILGSVRMKHCWLIRILTGLWLCNLTWSGR